MTAWQRNIAVPSGAGSSKEVWIRRQCGIIQMLNLVYFAYVLFLWFVCPGRQIAMWFMFGYYVYWNNNNNSNNSNNNFKFRPFLLRYTITIQWLPVVHGLHSLSCIAKINTRDLSAMKDTLRKDRDPIFNKIIKFSNSITYFRNRAMLHVFCILFIYHLPPSVILSVNEDSFWNLSWSGKSALSPF